MSTKDPYTTLGVSRNASTDEIKKAYRKLAHQFHPDKKGGDEAKFKEINEAYQILSDPKKKANFDAFGFGYNDGGFQGFGSGQSQQGYGGFWDFFGGGQSNRNAGGFEDVFEAFSDAFSGTSRYSDEATKGEDIYLEVPMSKKDLGSRRIFEFESMKVCPSCDGIGVQKGHDMVDCSNCQGAGQVRQTTRSPFGSFTRVTVCPECRGKRKKPEKVCSECKGETRVTAKRRIELQMPKDLEDGYTIVIPKGGNAGREGLPSGDLVINFKMK